MHPEIRYKEVLLHLFLLFIERNNPLLKIEKKV